MNTPPFYKSLSTWEKKKVGNLRSNFPFLSILVATLRYLQKRSEPPKHLPCFSWCHTQIHLFLVSFPLKRMTKPCIRSYPTSGSVAWVIWDSQFWDLEISKTSRVSRKALPGFQAKHVCFPLRSRIYMCIYIYTWWVPTSYEWSHNHTNGLINW